MGDGREKSFVRKRVLFTYNSMLYKLDNIHLKQTYHGEPYKSTFHQIEGSDIFVRKSFENIYSEHKFLLEDEASVVQQNKKKVDELALTTANKNTDDNELLLKNIFDVIDDTEADSDLSIDGGSYSDAENNINLMPVHEREKEKKTLDSDTNKLVSDTVGHNERVDNKKPVSDTVGHHERVESVCDDGKGTICHDSNIRLYDKLGSITQYTRTNTTHDEQDLLDHDNTTHDEQDSLDHDNTTHDEQDSLDHDNKTHDEQDSLDHDNTTHDEQDSLDHDNIGFQDDRESNGPRGSHVPNTENHDYVVRIPESSQTPIVEIVNDHKTETSISQSSKTQNTNIHKKNHALNIQNISETTKTYKWDEQSSQETLTVDIVNIHEIGTPNTDVQDDYDTSIPPSSLTTYTDIRVDHEIDIPQSSLTTNTDIRDDREIDIPQSSETPYNDIRDDDETGIPQISEKSNVYIREDHEMGNPHSPETPNTNIHNHEISIPRRVETPNTNIQNHEISIPQRVETPNTNIHTHEMSIPQRVETPNTNIHNHELSIQKSLETLNTDKHDDHETWSYNASIVDRSTTLNVQEKDIRSKLNTEDVTDMDAIKAFTPTIELNSFKTDTIMCRVYTDISVSTEKKSFSDKNNADTTCSNFKVMPTNIDAHQVVGTDLALKEIDVNDNTHKSVCTKQSLTLTTDSSIEKLNTLASKNKPLKDCSNSFRYRPSVLFIKEYDNSPSLIGDLFGNSVTKSDIGVSLYDKNSQKKKSQNMHRYNENHIVNGHEETGETVRIGNNKNETDNVIPGNKHETDNVIPGNKTETYSRIIYETKNHTPERVVNNEKLTLKNISTNGKQRTAFSASYPKLNTSHELFNNTFSMYVGIRRYDDRADDNQVRRQTTVYNNNVQNLPSLDQNIVFVENACSEKQKIYNKSQIKGEEICSELYLADEINTRIEQKDENMVGGTNTYPEATPHKSLKTEIVGFADQSQVLDTASPRKLITHMERPGYSDDLLTSSLLIDKPTISDISFFNGQLETEDVSVDCSTSELDLRTVNDTSEFKKVYIEKAYITPNRRELIDGNNEDTNQSPLWKEQIEEISKATTKEKMDEGNIDEADEIPTERDINQRNNDETDEIPTEKDTDIGNNYKSDEIPTGGALDKGNNDEANRIPTRGEIDKRNNEEIDEIPTVVAIDNGNNDETYEIPTRGDIDKGNNVASDKTPIGAEIDEEINVKAYKTTTGGEIDQRNTSKTTVTREIDRRKTSETTATREIDEGNDDDTDKTLTVDEIENGDTKKSLIGKGKVSITIKRLDRPKKSKQDETRQAEYFPFMFSGKSSVRYLSNSKGHDSEYPTHKMIAENLANIPVLSGQDLNCPSCGEKVYGDGREIVCIDPVHQMLNKIPSLQTIAGKYGLVVHNIPGDGNCMFSAVIDQLRIAGDFKFTKDSLRSSAVDYLRDNPRQEDGSHLMCFLSAESWEEYLCRMNRDGEWGDHMILKGITEVIGRNVTVLSTSGNVTHLFPHHTVVSDDQSVDSVYLGHISGTHYVSLRPKDWEKTWSINAKIRRMTKNLASEENDDQTFNPKELDRSDSESDVNLDNIHQRQHTDNLDSLSRDIHYIDPVSKIPMMHLSYILRQVLHLDWFYKSITYQLVPSENTGKLLMEQIGSSSEGTNVRLRNFTKLKSKKLTGIVNRGECSRYIVYPPPSVYSFVTNNFEISCSFHEESEQVIKLLIETNETHAGYLRLRTNRCSSCQQSHGNTKNVNGKCYINYIPVDLTSDQPNTLSYVKGLKCPCWPEPAQEWITRYRPVGWPRNETVENISKLGCYIAHRSHENSFEKEIEFQFLFSEAEKRLIREEMSDDIKYCFYVFKAMVEFQTSNIGCKLPNYFLKTVLFYACESIPSETWRNSCGGCVLYMIELLLQWVRRRNLPNYFITRNNMIDHWEEICLDKFRENLEALRSFPCMVLHFVCENHGLPSWAIDSVMASSKKYKLERNIENVIENTFNPTTFYYLGYYLEKFHSYENVFSDLNEAFEKNLIWSGKSYDFRAFVEEFLLTINSGKVRRAFSEYVEDKLNINNGASPSLQHTIQDFLGPSYTGKYGKHSLTSTVDHWNSIDLFLSLQLNQGENQEVVNIARCLIDKCKQEMETSVVDVSEIDDDELKRQIVKSNHNITSHRLSKIIRYYDLLCICYKQMNQIELVQEIIFDYQEAVEKMPSRYYLSEIAKLWRKLEQPQKAQEIEDNMLSMLEDTDEDNTFPKQLFKVLFSNTYSS